MSICTHSFLEPAATGSPISDRTQLSSWPVSNRIFTLLTCTWTAFLVACTKQNIYTIFFVARIKQNIYTVFVLACTKWAFTQLSLWPILNRIFTLLCDLDQMDIHTAFFAACTKQNIHTAFIAACIKQNIHTVYFVAFSK